MAKNISDAGLFEFEDRVRGQTVLITGAANGLGRAAAIEFGKRGANVVIGDIDVTGAEETVAEIKRTGGDGVCQACNVLDYDDLVSLFQLAVSKFGGVDVVIPNAGLAVGGLTTISLDERGLPKKPDIKTLEVNVIAVVYTTQLAYHYLTTNKKEHSLKTVVLIGSMSSLNGILGAPLYAASKHAVLGLMRSLAPEFKLEGLRIATVCPWFADTSIVPAVFKAFMAGIPMVPVPKVAGAIFLAATDVDPETNGAAYTLPDEREVFRIPHQEINEGVYKLLNDRAKRVIGAKY